MAVLIESMVFTKEKMQLLNIPEGTLPEGWWIGFKVWTRMSGIRSRMAHILCSALKERPSEEKITEEE